MSRNKQHKRDLKKFKAMMNIVEKPKVEFFDVSMVARDFIADRLSKSSFIDTMFPCKKV